LLLKWVSTSPEAQRMKMPPFDYACPATLSEAVALLASGNGEAKALAGGQSLLPMLAFRLAQPSLLVDLRKLSDLREISLSADGVQLGAMVRWRDILDDARLISAHPLLRAAVAEVAHYQIRNRGTVGGSLAHADPAAEMPGIAVTCEAEITVTGKAGPRAIKAADFFHGALTTALAADEIIVDVRLPKWPAQRRWGFMEFARRRGDFALAAAAVFYDLDANGTACNAHIGAIGVADRPLRLSSAEATLNGRLVDDETIAQVEAAASAAAHPQDDIHASGAYRRALIGTMVERALKAARAR
jgi:carbon-monoxide dehydrogenase medium subunit